MARIRSVKPAFFRHEKLQDIEAAHPGQYVMLVYIGLWTQCDSTGIFPWRPRQLKLDILPFLAFNIEETLDILRENGFIERYIAAGETWGLIPKFREHQRLSGKEMTDGERYPSPPGKQPGSAREATGKQLVAQERSTGKETGEEEGSNTRAQEDDKIFKNSDDAQGIFASVYEAISAWGESDAGHAEIVSWKKVTGYRDSQHGPTTDELAKFVSYHLGPKNNAANRAQFVADPLGYFRTQFPGWLTNAKAWNKPPDNAREYPSRRKNGSETGPSSLASILKQQT